MAGVDALAAVDQLADVNVHIDEHQRDGHNAIRISTHFYNTRTEIDNAVDHLLSIRGTMHST
jgi:selenocysteine lyase/cysteine desulfurase